MSEPRWRAFTVGNTEELDEVLEIYRSRTKKTPKVARLSTRCRTDILEKARELFCEAVEQVTWLLPFVIWLTHETPHQECK